MSIYSNTKKIGKNLKGLLGLKSHDIILTSFPKSGNTWVRFFFCNIISAKKWNGEEVGFPVLDKTMPELGVNNLLYRWPHNDLFPRIVKTHRTYLPFFRKNPTILIVRDPRDTMVSYYRFLTKRNKPLFEGSFAEFIRSKRFGLPAWFKYHYSWLKHKEPIVLTYEDLRANDLEIFSWLLKQLGVQISQNTLEEATVRCRIGQVRKAEDKYGPSNPNAKKDREFKFTGGGGSSGKWKEWFSEQDYRYYLDLLARYQLSQINYQDTD